MSEHSCHACKFCGFATNKGGHVIYYDTSTQYYQEYHDFPMESENIQQSIGHNDMYHGLARSPKYGMRTCDVEPLVSIGKPLLIVSLIYSISSRLACWQMGLANMQCSICHTRTENISQSFLQYIQTPKIMKQKRLLSTKSASQCLIFQHCY